MAAIASIQFAAGVRTPASAAKSLKATSSSSSFMGARVAAPARSVRTAAAGGLKVEAKYDAGVGVFGNKAGMTQLFTDEGLCVPVTVIAVQAGNVVTQVRTPSMTCDFSSSYARPSTPRASRSRRVVARPAGPATPGSEGLGHRRALTRAERWAIFVDPAGEISPHGALGYPLARASRHRRSDRQDAASRGPQLSPSRARPRAPFRPRPLKKEPPADPRPYPLFSSTTGEDRGYRRLQRGSGRLRLGG